MNARFPHLSFITCCFISILLIARFVSDGFQDTIKWDIAGYYMYLPQTLIEGDPGIRNDDHLKALNEKYEFSPTLYQVHFNETTGCYVIQYTGGMAVMYLPAFAVAHCIAHISHQEADGYSTVYAASLGIWSLAIAILGVFFLRRALLLQYNDAITAVAIMLACVGMNFYMQVSKSLASPHTYLFALYAILLYFTIAWHKQPKRSYFFAIVVVIALLCLSRPTEVFAAALPLLWNVKFSSIRKDIAAKFYHIRKDMILGLAIVLGIGSIQLVYWKYTAGSFLHMSYSNPGEGFDFTHPHTADFLFSFRKGWFIYTPLALLIVPAFWLLWKNKKELVLPFLLFFIPTIFVASSWSCWWYAQCFSQRTMVQSLPILAFLFALVIEWLAGSSLRKWIGGSAIAILFSLSVFYQWQYFHGIIDSYRMTKAYFEKIFLTTEKNPQWDHLLLISRSFDGINTFDDSKYIKVNEWNQIVSGSAEKADSAAFVLYHEREFSPPVEFQYGRVTAKDHLWFAFSGFARADSLQQGEVLRVVITATHQGGAYGYTAIDLPADSLMRPEGFHFKYHYLTPDMRSGDDKISFYCWYVGNHQAWVSDFHIEAFERKEAY